MLSIVCLNDNRDLLKSLRAVTILEHALKELDLIVRCAGNFFPLLKYCPSVLENQ